MSSVALVARIGVWISAVAFSITLLLRAAVGQVENVGAQQEAFVWVDTFSRASIISLAVSLVVLAAGVVRALGGRSAALHLNGAAFALSFAAASLGSYSLSEGVEGVSALVAQFSFGIGLGVAGGSLYLLTRLSKVAQEQGV